MWHSSSVDIWKSITGAPTDKIVEGSAVTVGVFDGVHRGHQALMKDVAALAASENLLSVAITFDPHPISIIAPERTPESLTSLERRVELLHAHGIDEVRILNFSAAVSQWSPDEFIKRVIVDQCSTKHLVVGENFRFGSRAAGDVEYLQQRGPQYGYQVAAQTLVGDGNGFSSSRVREAIAKGNMSVATEILGRFHEVSGPIVTGDRRGRTLGFPTANIAVPAGRAIPADGVYASWLVVAGERYPAATSVGTNPTFDGITERRVEAYALDRTDLDIYGLEARVEFAEQIRGMEQFSGVDELVARMHLDVARTREILDISAI